MPTCSGAHSSLLQLATAPVWRLALGEALDVQELLGQDKSRGILQAALCLRLPLTLVCVGFACCCDCCCHPGGHGGNSGSSCPFATIPEAEVAAQWQRSNYHAKSQPKAMADKVRPGSGLPQRPGEGVQIFFGAPPAVQLANTSGAPHRLAQKLDPLQSAQPPPQHCSLLRSLQGMKFMPGLGRQVSCALSWHCRERYTAAGARAGQAPWLTKSFRTCAGAGGVTCRLAATRALTPLCTAATW